MNERATRENPAAVSDRDVEQGAVRGSIPAGEAEREGLLPRGTLTDLHARWTDVQAGFVDDPETAVRRAQELVDTVVRELTELFSRERSELEKQWSANGEADTEALRVTLQRYRSFFNRLLGPS